MQREEDSTFERPYSSERSKRQTRMILRAESAFQLRISVLRGVFGEDISKSL